MSGPRMEDIAHCSDKLDDTQMARFATMDLASLRAAANRHAIRRRMTEDMREELDDMYYDYQCAAVRLAIQNRVGAHLYFDHLGQTRRVRGSTSWNNFQKYDPQAQKLYDECECFKLFYWCFIYRTMY